MNGIPTELLFVIIFIVFSVLEALGRKKKAGRTGTGAPGPRPRRSPREASEGPAASRKSAEGDEGSQGLIPEDVWEEILGLARGTPPEIEREEREEPDSRHPGRPLPDPEGQTLEEIPPFEARSLEPLEPRPEPRRDAPAAPDIPRERVEMPPVPGSRVESLPSLAATEVGGDAEVGAGVDIGSLGATLAARRRPGPGRLRRDLFRGGSVAELRRAVVLKEVLGPPVGLQE